MSETLRGYPAETADLTVAVDPWKHNPSAWSQRLPICGLALVAAVIAAYMSLYQWRLVDSVWDPIFGEQSARVLDSDVAKMMYRWFGIHDAAFGALAYLGDAIFGLAGSTRRWQYRPWMVVLFGIDVIPLGLVSAILVVAQAVVVGQWCFLCLVTAVISLILVWMAVDEVYSSLKWLYRTWQRTGSAAAVWRVFIGRPVESADEVAAEMVRKAA